MESDSGAKSNKKRGRSLEDNRESEERKLSEKTPPNKRHTRSQSRRRSVQETTRGGEGQASSNHTVGRSLEREIEEIVCAEEREEANMAAKNPENVNSIRSIPDMAKFFEDKFAALPTTQYLDERLDKMQRKTDETANGLKLLEQRVERIENVNTALVRATEARINIPNTHQSQIALTREDAFLRAIRSIRLWPLIPSSGGSLEAAFDEFLRTALCMSKQDLEQVILEDIYKVRSSPRSRQHDEVCAVFRDQETRELLLSYARNLSTYVDSNGDPTAGLRLEIPSHLMMTHRLLTMYGYNLRNRHGKETRRIIKFDLIEQSLYLAYKLPGSELWHEITPAMAKTYKDRENQRSLLNFSESLSPVSNRSVLTGANATLVSESSSGTRSQPPPQLRTRLENAPAGQTWTPGRHERSR